MSDFKKVDRECQTITEKEMKLRERIVNLENSDQKQDQQRRMAAVALTSIIALTIFLMLPFLSNDRIEALSDVFTMFYVANAGIIASFFGSTAYMSVNR